MTGAKRARPLGATISDIPLALMRQDRLQVRQMDAMAAESTLVQGFVRLAGQASE